MSEPVVLRLELERLKLTTLRFIEEALNREALKAVVAKAIDTLDLEAMARTLVITEVRRVVQQKLEFEVTRRLAAASGLLDQSVQRAVKDVAAKLDLQGLWP